MKRFLIGALIIGLLGAGLGFVSLRQAEARGCPPVTCPTKAECSPCSPAKAGESKSIVGEMICPSCVLSKSHEAKSQCSIYGCPLALRLGNGLILTFLENDKSTELVRNKSKYNGKRVVVKGRIFPNTQIIEVESYKVVR